MLGLAGRDEIGNEAVDAVAFFVKIVVAIFEADILKDQEEGGHAYCETDDIEGGKSLVAPEAADGDREVFL